MPARFALPLQPEKKHHILADPFVDLSQLAKHFQVRGQSCQLLLFFLGVGASAKQGDIFALVDEAQWENGED